MAIRKKINKNKRRAFLKLVILLAIVLILIVLEYTATPYLRGRAWGVLLFGMGVIVLLIGLKAKKYFGEHGLLGSIKLSVKELLET